MYLKFQSLEGDKHAVGETSGKKAETNPSNEKKPVTIEDVPDPILVRSMV
jgi:hypothetical protein